MRILSAGLILLAIAFEAHSAIPHLLRAGQPTVSNAAQAPTTPPSFFGTQLFVVNAAATDFAPPPRRSWIPSPPPPASPLVRLRRIPTTINPPA